MARYLRLRGSSDIRLLEVLPGSSSEPLKCKMIVQSLVQTEESSFAANSSSIYDAVSYVWTPNNDEEVEHVIPSGRDGERVDENEIPIYVNGWICNVKPNLWMFLREYRRRGLAVSIWVDLLCIDQVGRLQMLRLSRIYTM